METLSTQSEAAAYSSDNTCKEDAVKHAQVLLPSDSKGDSSFDNDVGRNKYPLPLDTNEISGGQAEQEQEMEHPLQSNELVSDGASQPDNLIASDGTESPMPNSVESVVAAYGSSPKLSGAGPSEGTPYLEQTLDSEVSLPENQQMDETLTLDITVIDSRDVVSVQEISDPAVEAASLPKDKDTEQNPELSNKDEISPSGLPDYIEYGSADQMLPFGLHDLRTEGGKLGKGEETLASDQNEGDIELENQIDLFKSTAPDKSFSSAGIPAPSLLSAALQMPVGQIVVPAAVDPTQGNALAALQVLKVFFMHSLSFEWIRILVRSVFIIELFV